MENQFNLFAPRKPRPKLDRGVWEVCERALQDGDDDHKKVLQALLDDATTEHNTRTTQAQLAQRVPTLGAHRREHEADPKTKGNRDTTLRKVRQVIRDLRVVYGVPVLSSPKGYWLPSTVDEVDEYVERAERQARATAAAWFETYRAVRPFASRGGKTLDLFAGTVDD